MRRPHLGGDDLCALNVTGDHESAACYENLMTDSETCFVRRCFVVFLQMFFFFYEQITRFHRVVVRELISNSVWNI